MTQRNQIEQDLLAKAARYLPGSGTGNTNYPDELKFLVREGKGGRVWDVSGNEYVDWLMGSGPMILGHAHPAVTEAVSQAVGRGSTFFTTNEQAVMLAEELVNAVPCAEQVRFTTSGTDACFQAMRVARAFTGKEKILKFEGGFPRHQRLRHDVRLRLRLRRVPPGRSQQRRHPPRHQRLDADFPVQRPRYHRRHHRRP